MTIPTWLEVLVVTDAVGAALVLIGFRALLRYNAHHYKEES